MENFEKNEYQDIQLAEAEKYRIAAEAHRQAAKTAWKTFWKTGVFVLTSTMGALFIFSLGWFVMNSRVSSGVATVSAQQDVIWIASKGVRQEAEMYSQLGLADGKWIEYGEYKEKYYYTENDEIAMRLSENYSVSPGASGSIEFYIIPTSDGSRTVTLYLGLAAYKKDETDMAVTAQDEVLDALLKGHILLFKNRGDFYSEWLYSSDSNGIFQNTITVELPKDATAGVPYQYIIYWIWPKRYENLVSHRSDKGDLFVVDSEEFNEVFSPFVEVQSLETSATCINNTTYSYSNLFVSKDWSSSLGDAQRTKAYNLADEYIGTNADYLYLTIRTAPLE